MPDTLLEGCMEANETHPAFASYVSGALPMDNRLVRIYIGVPRLAQTVLRNEEA